MNRIKSYVYLVICVFISASCVASKSLTYFSDMKTGTDYPVQPVKEIKVQSGDRLNIAVSCKNPELALPFNVINGTFSVDASDPESVKTSVNGDKIKAYLVDGDGYIDFPVLGPQKVAGMTLFEIKDNLTRQIVDMGFIKEPIVTVDMTNFTITLIGELSPQNYIVEGNSINIIQALSLAGNLPVTADINDICVIRTENGLRRKYSVDIQSKDLFDSPVFNLQQNDIIYVKPKGLKAGNSMTLISQYANLGFSLLTLLSNIMIWSRLYK